MRAPPLKPPLPFPILGGAAAAGAKPPVAVIDAAMEFKLASASRRSGGGALRSTCFGGGVFITEVGTVLAEESTAGIDVVVVSFA
jgi:hypothetical protein